ncbi:MULTISPECIES: hypothetical protein [Mycobacterium]|uniref:Uncharacterized protein n=1 Tax=Mycobacterium gordonae TaxID=1778 RepID=A0A1X1X7E9_MYCGO|nr:MULTISPECIES: hypothetical protein [Mycobacterium]ORV94817.1 hypothetical protein AWC08_16225 [Mycobacterium gordonae]PJE05514.1 MAG: hypothetical protein CK428_26040 [Mycobacterium sp.]TDK94724.1 hypothetical protein EI067_19030 [Mycobacterium paragordonae]
MTRQAVGVVKGVGGVVAIDVGDQLLDLVARFLHGARHRGWKFRCAGGVLPVLRAAEDAGGTAVKHAQNSLVVMLTELAARTALSAADGNSLIAAPVCSQRGLSRALHAPNRPRGCENTQNNPVRPSASVPAWAGGKDVVVASGVVGCDQVVGGNVGAGYDRHG